MAFNRVLQSLAVATALQSTSTGVFAKPTGPIRPPGHPGHPGTPACPRDGDAQDYVIVGGGPAGFVVAEYLTRNPDVSVTLLEAGADLDTHPNIESPGRFAFNSEGIWLFFTEPDANLNGRTPDLGQGQSLGGGSTINNMNYCRGSASVFDEWARVSGNTGLAWKPMLEAFKATSTWDNDPSITYDQPVNAKVFGKGPLKVSRQRELFELDEPLAQAMQEKLDVDVIDFVSGGGIGVSQGLNTIRASNRTRSYAYNSFGYLANNRKNFNLVTNALVSTVGFTGTKADKVTYNDTLTSTMKTIDANEVIIAAGAVKSPHILMLSGVGPADVLEKFGIPVVKDLPAVGQNLIDHHNAVVQYTASPAELTQWQYNYNKTVADEANEAWMHNGDGVLGTQWGDVIGAARVPDEVFEGIDGSFFTNLPSDRPHLAYTYSNTGIGASPANVSSVGAWVGLVQPEGSGNITLKSANYLDSPAIYSNYFGTPADRAAILYGYKKLREIMTADVVKPIIPEELFPGPNVTSDEDLWAAIVQTARSWHHPVGTVSLGSALDANWRVKGVQGLRVVGSPAMPYVATCPIQSTVYAMAYRSAIDIARADGL